VIIVTFVEQTQTKRFDLVLVQIFKPVCNVVREFVQKEIFVGNRIVVVVNFRKQIFFDHVQFDDLNQQLNNFDLKFESVFVKRISHRNENVVENRKIIRAKKQIANIDSVHVFDIGDFFNQNLHRFQTSFVHNRRFVLDRPQNRVDDVFVEVVLLDFENTIKRI
jgi:hypothetical protein